MENNIYLDIDMDYFIEPIEKSSVDNMRPFYNNDCVISDVKPVVSGLKKAGLKWERKAIHCFTNHKKSYTYWWMVKNMNCTVIHIDAHSDLYRNRERDLRTLSNGEIGCYNYLWYAIRDGYVAEIYWVVPDSLNAVCVDINYAESIIYQSLIKEKDVDENGLHILFECIDFSGCEKTVKLHVCSIEMLPSFDQTCETVTIATSPEFIPSKADHLIFKLFEQFGIEKATSDNIFNQHRDMLIEQPDGSDGK